MSKRTSISKKTRFEIFKRDDFRCSYCGKTPPQVVLEIDHITPVSGGGDNDHNNLLTSCFDCNRGKGAIALERITPGMEENLEILKEKEAQLKEYKRFIVKVKKRETKEIDDICDIFETAFPGKTMADRFKQVSMKTFIKALPFNEIEDAMVIASTRIHRDADDALKYFCGICWRKIKG